MMYGANEKIPTVEDESKAPASSKPEDDNQLRRAQLLLYASHAVAELANGTWQFAVILFLSAVTHYQSVLLVTTYTMMTYACVCFAGASMGDWIDGSSRLRTAQLLLLLNNTSVIMASLACCWLLVRNAADPSSISDKTVPIPTDPLSLLLIATIHILGSTAELFDQSFAVAVERDWIVAMSPSTTWLSHTNVTMRQIDLTCKVLAPILAGWIVQQQQSDSMCDLHSAALLVGILNGTALLAEYVGTYQIYCMIPALAMRQQASKCLQGVKVDPEEYWGEEEDISEEGSTNSTLCQGLRVYLQQSVSWAGLSMAFIYVNTLSFGGIMTGYLLSRGLPLDQIGLWRGASSVSGLLGTMIYPFAARHRSVVAIGQWSVVFLFLCISVALVAFYWTTKANNGFGITLFLLACCASRMGLWVFDVVVTVLMQEFVPAGSRGTVGGTQKSLDSFFVLASSSLGLYFSKPEQFYVFATSSFSAIGVAVLLYTFGVYRHRSYFLVSTGNDNSHYGCATD